MRSSSAWLRSILLAVTSRQNVHDSAWLEVAMHAQILHDSSAGVTGTRMVKLQL